MEVVSVATGVMKPLLSKLTKLLGEEYVKFKGVRKQIRFLRDELSAMSATLEVLADVEQLNPEVRLWRDKLRELAYDLEDCIDGFMARVDQGHDGHTGFIKKFFRVLKRSKARHEIGNQIEELKACVMEASERHKRYKSDMPSSSGTCYGVDPRLAALYVEIDELVGIDGPKKHIIEWLNMENQASSGELKSGELKVLSIVGCGGVGKTTLANQVYQSVKSQLSCKVINGLEDRNKNTLANQVYQSVKSQLSSEVIAIADLGGLDKTSLANEFYQTVKGQFSCAAFVSVSRNPNVKKILRDIATEVGVMDNVLDFDEKQLTDKIKGHLKKKRCLVVIDDIWDVKPWETIKPALVAEESKIRVITTTRSTAVASCLSSQGGNVYQMKSLSFEDSKRLLFKRAFGSENSSFAHLGSVPYEILKKCDGLPLAIITISSMLADKHAKCEWERVLSDIGSALANNPGAEKMTTILSMSYFDIPHHLRTCLLYLSVFPEDYVIRKHFLINKWIPEGFIHEEVGRTKYEIGEGYFNDLINRSMIQPVDVIHGQAKACRVHDIILDYIKCKAAEENFITSLDASEHAYTSEYKARRLCVSNYDANNVTLWASLVLSQVRSVTVFGRPVKTSLLPFTALRVLDLGDCWGMETNHLASIENMFLLKYLRLSSHSITKLPEKIGELQYLETLDIEGTSIYELPSTTIRLQRLAHLYVNRDIRFPDGMIRQMHGLEEVMQYGVRSYKQGKSLQDFSRLTKLRTLKVIWNVRLPNGAERIFQAKEFHSNVGALLSSCNLQNLYLTGFPEEYPLSLDSWSPAAPCSMRKLCIKECFIHKVPSWMVSLGNLGVLELRIICLGPEDVEILGAIPSLLFLQLETVGGTNGRIIIQGSNGFRSLKYFSLAIFCCGSALEFKAGSMPKLEYVEIEFCLHKFDCLNGASNFGIQHLSAVSKVQIQIYGDCMEYSNYNPEKDNDNDIIRCVTRAINAAVETLPNRPTIRFKTLYDEWLCVHFERRSRDFNED